MRGAVRRIRCCDRRQGTRCSARFAHLSDGENFGSTGGEIDSAGFLQDNEGGRLKSACFCNVPDGNVVKALSIARQLPTAAFDAAFGR
jgi:hypothetical protein